MHLGTLRRVSVWESWRGGAPASSPVGFHARHEAASPFVYRFLQRCQHFAQLTFLSTTKRFAKGRTNVAKGVFRTINNDCI